MSVAPLYEMSTGIDEEYLPADYEIPDEELTQTSEAVRAPLTEAESALVEENIGLVYAIAHKFRSQGKMFDLDDSIGYGFEGLCIAAQTFDETRGTSFGSLCRN